MNSIARARAAQLDRVNNDTAKLRHDLDEARAIIERQAQMIRDMRARLEAYENDAPAAVHHPAESAALYRGRPYISADAAARQMHISTATVNRYLNSGFWAGDRPDGYHWIVYTDQPMPVKPRR